jgi:hypothetical protein
MKNKNYFLLIIILIFIGAIATAQVSHLASEILAGNFSAGNFGFLGNVEVSKSGEVFVNIKNTEANGRDYALVSAGSDGGIGVGKFVIFDKTQDISRLEISPTGYVEVHNAVKVGNSGNTCNANLEGAIRYNSNDKIMEFCNGAEWCKFDGSVC